MVVAIIIHRRTPWAALLHSSTTCQRFWRFQRDSSTIAIALAISRVRQSTALIQRLDRFLERCPRRHNGRYDWSEAGLIWAFFLAYLCNVFSARDLHCLECAEDNSV